MFIGLKLIFKQVKTDKPNNNADKPISNKRGHRLFLDGFIIAIGNPKDILFFTALFPQFINAKYASIGVFMIVFITSGIVAFGCYM